MNQSLNPEFRNNITLFWRSYETHKYTVWTERRVFSRVHKLRKATLNFINSNLVFKHFSKTCRQNSGFIKIRQNNKYFI